MSLVVQDESSVGHSSHVGGEAGAANAIFGGLETTNSANQYERLHELGRGAGGVVYVCRRLCDDRLFAVKEVRYLTSGVDHTNNHGISAPGNHINRNRKKKSRHHSRGHSSNTAAGRGHSKSSTVGSDETSNTACMSSSPNQSNFDDPRQSMLCNHSAATTMMGASDEGAVQLLPPAVIISEMPVEQDDAVSCPEPQQACEQINDNVKVDPTDCPVDSSPNTSNSSGPLSTSNGGSVDGGCLDEPVVDSSSVSAHGGGIIVGIRRFGTPMDGTNQCGGGEARSGEPTSVVEGSSDEKASGERAPQVISFVDDQLEYENEPSAVNADAVPRDATLQYETEEPPAPGVEVEADVSPSDGSSASDDGHSSSSSSADEDSPRRSEALNTTINNRRSVLAEGTLMASIPRHPNIVQIEEIVEEMPHSELVQLLRRRRDMMHEAPLTVVHASDHRNLQTNNNNPLDSASDEVSNDQSRHQAPTVPEEGESWNHQSDGQFATHASVSGTSGDGAFYAASLADNLNSMFTAGNGGGGMPTYRTVYIVMEYMPSGSMREHVYPMGLIQQREDKKEQRRRAERAAQRERRRLRRLQREAQQQQGAPIAAEGSAGDRPYPFSNSSNDNGSGEWGWGVYGSGNSEPLPDGFASAANGDGLPAGTSNQRRRTDAFIEGGRGNPDGSVGDSPADAVSLCADNGDDDQGFGGDEVMTNGPFFARIADPSLRRSLGSVYSRLVAEALAMEAESAAGENQSSVADAAVQQQPNAVADPSDVFTGSAITNAVVAETFANSDGGIAEAAGRSASLCRADDSVADQSGLEYDAQNDIDGNVTRHIPNRDTNIPHPRREFLPSRIRYSTLGSELDDDGLFDFFKQQSGKVSAFDGARVWDATTAVSDDPVRIAARAARSRRMRMKRYSSTNTPDNCLSGAISVHEPKEASEVADEISQQAMRCIPRPPAILASAVRKAIPVDNLRRSRNRKAPPFPCTFSLDIARDYVDVDDDYHQHHVQPQSAFAAASLSAKGRGNSIDFAFGGAILGEGTISAAALVNSRGGIISASSSDLSPRRRSSVTIVDASHRLTPQLPSVGDGGGSAGQSLSVVNGVTSTLIGGINRPSSQLSFADADGSNNGGHGGNTAATAAPSVVGPNSAASSYLTPLFGYASMGSSAAQSIGASSSAASSAPYSPFSPASNARSQFPLFTEAELLEWFDQLSNAVEFLHSKGIAHRDIKLDNILLVDGPADSDDGEGDGGEVLTDAPHRAEVEVEEECMGSPRRHGPASFPSPAAITAITPHCPEEPQPLKHKKRSTKKICKLCDFGVAATVTLGAIGAIGAASLSAETLLTNYKRRPRGDGNDEEGEKSVAEDGRAAVATMMTTARNHTMATTNLGGTLMTITGHFSVAAYATFINNSYIRSPSELSNDGLSSGGAIVHGISPSSPTDPTPQASSITFFASPKELCIPSSPFGLPRQQGFTATVGGGGVGLLGDLATASLTLHIAHNNSSTNPNNMLSSASCGYSIAHKSFDDGTVGTPQYMPPEICDGRPHSLQCDVWSLGVSFYEMACRRLPFDAQNMLALMHKVIEHPARALPMPPFSRRLNAIILSMLAKDPRRRPTMRQVVQMFAHYRRLAHAMEEARAALAEALEVVQTVEAIRTAQLGFEEAWAAFENVGAYGEAKGALGPAEFAAAPQPEHPRTLAKMLQLAADAAATSVSFNYNNNANTNANDVIAGNTAGSNSNSADYDVENAFSLNPHSPTVALYASGGGLAAVHNLRQHQSSGATSRVPNGFNGGGSDKASSSAENPATPLVFNTVQTSVCAQRKVGEGPCSPMVNGKGAALSGGDEPLFLASFTPIVAATLAQISLGSIM